MDHMVHPPPSISEAAARWVIELMNTKGFSLRSFAEATLIPRATLVRRFKAQPHNFTVGELEAIARVLEVKVSEIVVAGERDAA